MHQTDRNRAMWVAKRSGKSYRAIAKEYGLAVGRTFRIIAKEEQRQEAIAIAQKGRIYPAALADERGRMMYDALQAVVGGQADRVQILREWGYRPNGRDGMGLCRQIAKIAMAGPDARRDNDIDPDLILF